jgi:hypothetical protein
MTYEHTSTAKLQYLVQLAESIVLGKLAKVAQIQAEVAEWEQTLAERKEALASRKPVESPDAEGRG